MQNRSRAQQPFGVLAVIAGGVMLSLAPKGSQGRQAAPAVAPAAAAQSTVELRPEFFFQTQFPAEEFSARRAKLMDQIGPDAVAIVQGSPPVRGFAPFRQTNEFYYLCGVERPQSYIVMDARSKKSTLFVPHRDLSTERAEGREIGVEDKDMLVKLTGVDDVKGLESITDALKGAKIIYSPWAPAEWITGSRDELTKADRFVAADPWDNLETREWHLYNLIKERVPGADQQDLTNILDGLRAIKSPREIEVLRRAGQLSALGVIEAMKSTKPGLFEYQLEAASRYVYFLNGAQQLGYRAILASSDQNIPNMHYYRNSRALESTDMILMDFAPDVGNYTSDIGRMWPVSGKYPQYMRELYGFVIKYHKTVLSVLRPGVTQAQLRQEIQKIMQPAFDGWHFSRPEYKQACQRLLQTGGGDFSHSVGMAVHDVPTARRGVLQEGMVFSIDPALMNFQSEGRTLYIRCEDTIAITKDGCEVLTGQAPYDLDEVEALVQKGGGIVSALPPVGPQTPILIKGVPPPNMVYTATNDTGTSRGAGRRGGRGAGAGARGVRGRAGDAATSGTLAGGQVRGRRAGGGAGGAGGRGNAPSSD